MKFYHMHELPLVIEEIKQLPITDINKYINMINH